MTVQRTDFLSRSVMEHRLIKDYRSLIFRSLLDKKTSTAEIHSTLLVHFNDSWTFDDVRERLVNFEVLLTDTKEGILFGGFEISKLEMSTPVYRDQWNVQASDIARRTHNPIRSIVECLVVEPNPAKSMISLSIGEVFLYTQFISRLSF